MKTKESKADKERRLRVLEAAKFLAKGWAAYSFLFGTVPHGTEKQLAALIELSHPKKWLLRGLEKRGRDRTIISTPDGGVGVA